MLRNLLILALAYFVYRLVRGFLTKRAGSPGGQWFSSRSRQDGRSRSGAVDAEFEDLDDQGS